MSMLIVSHLSKIGTTISLYSAAPIGGKPYLVETVGNGRRDHHRYAALEAAYTETIRLINAHKTTVA